MSKEAPVSIARVLTAKDDLLVVEKTSSENVRQQTQSSVNKVVIGKVGTYVIFKANESIRSSRQCLLTCVCSNDKISILTSLAKSL